MQQRKNEEKKQKKTKLKICKDTKNTKRKDYEKNKNTGWAWAKPSFPEFTNAFQEKLAVQQ